MLEGAEASAGPEITTLILKSKTPNTDIFDVIHENSSYRTEKDSIG